MKPLEKEQYINAYVLFRLDNMGKFVLETSSVTEQGDFGSAVYSDIKKAQYQQMILALKGIKVEIYHLEYPL